VEELMLELEKYHAIYSPLMSAKKQREYSYHYLLGLLDPEIKRKSAENIALATLGSESVRQMQHFVGQSNWRDARLLAEHRRQTGLMLGESSGVIILDGSDCAKQGDHSVGVQRQWCGELGKRANCQAGVYLGYSSSKGYSLLDRRLYMPECWFTPEYTERRYKCRVPIDLTFQTKNQLAWEMILELHQADSLSASWITMDEAFGRDTKLLDRIDSETDYYYMAEVPKNTRVWRQEPRTCVPEYTGAGRPPTRLQLAADAVAALTVEQVAAQLSPDAWELHALKEGAKGLIVAEIALCRVISVRDGLPGLPVWLLLRRSPSAPQEIHYFLCNAPEKIAANVMIEVCALRWPIETMFEQAKQFVGLNEYETRTWFGWHHHMTLVILAFGFLARCQLALKPDSPALTVPQVVDLLKAVLPKPDFDAQAALDLLRYKQSRIARAKQSHYSMQKKRSIDPLLVPQ
jgi:SRSO17 transposase